MADLGGGHNLSTEVGGSHGWSPATNVEDSNGSEEREEDCKN